MSELNDLIQILKTESGYEMILNKKIDNLNSGYMYISENDNKEAYALSDKDLLDLEVGSVIGPFSPREGVLRIIKINGIEYRSDSLEARHIMIQPKNDINLDSAFMIIESIKEKINNNYDFSDLAQKFSDDRSSSIRGGDLGWFQEGIMVSEFNNACFEAEVGELSVVLTQFGVHLVEVTASSPEVPKLKIIYLEKYFDE